MKTERLLGGLVALMFAVSVISAVSMAEVNVTTTSEVNTTSSGTTPIATLHGPDFLSASGYISFSGFETDNLSMNISSELSVVDLTNTIELQPNVNGTMFFIYSLPNGVTMYLNSVVISILVIQLTLSGTPFSGSGSVNIYSGINVTAGQSLYLSYVLNGNSAYNGFVQIDFSPS